jgi:hypothetical protein
LGFELFAELGGQFCGFMLSSDEGAGTAGQDFLGVTGESTELLWIRRRDWINRQVSRPVIPAVTRAWGCDSFLPSFGHLRFWVRDGLDFINVSTVRALGFVATLNYGCTFALAFRTFEYCPV